MPIDRSAFITATPNQNVAFDYFYGEKSFIAKDMCNVIPIDKGDSKFSQFDLSKRRPIDDEKGTNAESNGIDEQIFERAITLKEYKLHKDINPRDVRDADMPSLLDEGRAVKLVTQQLLLQAEIRLADLALTSTNYPSTLTSALSSGSKWNEAGGSPETDLLTINTGLRNSCGRKANALTMDELTLEKLRLSPEWRARTQYTMPGKIPLDLVKAFFEVDYLFVGSARYDTALQGGTASMSAIWGDDAVFFVHDPATTLESQNAFVMAMVNAGFWTNTLELPTLRGAAGAMRRVEVGTEYLFTPGMVVSTSDSDMAAAYLLRDVVA